MCLACPADLPSQDWLHGTKIHEPNSLHCQGSLEYKGWLLERRTRLYYTTDILRHQVTG
ncbi:hypothetical protein QBC32DRAFT_351219 [Pseudoneurospora amorphoporcata]|uniref:Uncharacterized protein n=1 Tax=Pseudoneurospora amorphoporcata TaxID=241081 RepID=A0AAN6SCI6_9PEZI|nr:hypothetical protein QBC32DRAFT_351219 [Pseudoneurospora amorphoporcata]